ncbi:MAG: hypothetical protein IT195_10295 [Microthrixaceae bacterium]|nr:hypothetical protein [Microthrixaceae bacterium]
MADSDDIRECESWFLRRGIPLFIADYDADTRIWTRAVPFLAVAYLLLSAPISADRPLDAAIEWAIAVVVLIAAWAVGNLADRRPAFSRPTQVGWIELSAFVVGPALSHAIERDWLAAVVAAAGGLVVLACTYEVVAYGIVPLTGWMAERLLRSLSDLRAAAVRALPFLLLFVTFFFFTAETWQTFARLEGLPYGLTLLLFLGVGIAFVSARLRPDMEALEHFVSWDEVLAEARDTPAGVLGVPAEGGPSQAPLSKRERRNVLLVAVASQVILAVMVATVIGVFFLVLGTLTADAELIGSWVGHEPHVYLTLRLSGRPLIFTEEHIRVAGFLATFSGFYFGVYSVADPTFRQGLTDDSTTQLRATFAARLLYRGALVSSAATVATETGTSVQSADPRV